MNSLQDKVRLIENQYNSGDFYGAEVKAKELVKEYSKFPYLYDSKTYFLSIYFLYNHTKACFTAENNLIFLQVINCFI